MPAFVDTVMVFGADVAGASGVVVAVGSGITGVPKRRRFDFVRNGVAPRNIECISANIAVRSRSRCLVICSLLVRLSTVFVGT